MSFEDKLCLKFSRFSIFSIILPLLFTSQHFGGSLLPSSCPSVSRFTRKHLHNMLTQTYISSLITVVIQLLREQKPLDGK